MRRRSSILTAFSFACIRVRIVRRKHREAALPGRRAAVRETQEVEALGLPLAARPSIRRRVAAEFEESRFVGVQGQTEPREAFAQLGEKLLGVVSMLEAHDEVIGKADDDHVAVRLPLPPSLGPEVEDVVQVDIRQQRADTPALDGADLTDDALSLLQHARVQPFLDESHDAPVRHAVLDEANEPFVVQRIEEARMSASSTQFTFFVMMPTVSASSARCGLRFGRNPYENPRKSVS